MAELVLREGLEQPRPLAQIQALVGHAALQGALPPPGPVTLVCGAWLIGLQELDALRQSLATSGLEITAIASDEPHTRVAAAALGLVWHPCLSAGDASDAQPAETLQIHRGTLRSGDQLHGAGSLLVLGDVNPGAQVSAAGHVLVWGTLRGVAHAGCQGDTSARITALQLRPLQLRIADAVARGPEDLPIPGFAEQAELVDGLIAINPATPQWPIR